MKDTKAPEPSEKPAAERPKRFRKQQNSERKSASANPKAEAMKKESGDKPNPTKTEKNRRKRSRIS